MLRRNIPTPAPWAATVGYSRAVRAGDWVVVSGTAAVGPSGEVLAPGDAYAQTRAILQIIAAALREAGAELEHVVRTRIYVVDIAAHWQAVGRAHGECFAEIRPATSMVEVSRLIAPQMLVEIEADALLA